MKDTLFVIIGGQGRRHSPNGVRHGRTHERGDLETEKLKRSPCLSCELFERDTVCPYVEECSRIDEYQRLATGHCTLSKYSDMRSMF